MLYMLCIGKSRRASSPIFNFNSFTTLSLCLSYQWLRRFRKKNSSTPALPTDLASELARYDRSPFLPLSPPMRPLWLISQGTRLATRPRTSGLPESTCLWWERVGMV